MFDKIMIDWLPGILTIIFLLMFVCYKRNPFTGLVFSAITVILSFRLLHYYELISKVDRFFNVTMVIISILVAIASFVLCWNHRRK